MYCNPRNHTHISATVIQYLLPQMGGVSGVLDSESMALMTLAPAKGLKMYCIPRDHSNTSQG